MIFARLLAFAFLMLFSAPIMAAQSDEDQIGTVLEVEGSATVKSGGVTKSAAVDAPIHLGDQVVTGPGAKVFIQFIDGTEFTVGEKALISVDEYIYDPENIPENKARYSVLRGAFLYTSGLIAKKDKPDVEVNTPYGSVGIRGTQFWGGDIDEAYGIFVNDGQVEVKNEAGRATLAKGDGTSLKAKNAAPGEVRRWKEEKINRAVATISLRRPEIVARRIEARKALNREIVEGRKAKRGQRIEKLKENRKLAPRLRQKAE